MSVFSSADLLIPSEALLPDWAVIACDQFTSQPDYWRAVRAQVGDRPSAYRIVFPEAELGQDERGRIRSINETMRAYLEAELFRRFPDSYIYVERTLLDGSIRRGVVGTIDLDAYDYAADTVSPVRATEQTVVERIPPRVRIREGACLELSHVILLMDDASCTVLDSLTARRDALEPVYDFELMQGGGRIRGWLVSGGEAEAFAERIAAYEREAAQRFEAQGRAPLLYAVGDGNHSLATAKTCWERCREQGAAAEHPARRAMVELQNIRDESQRFEPIHRIVTGISPELLLGDCAALCGEGGHEVGWAAGERRGVLRLDRARGELPVAVLQPFLDEWLKENGGRIDYIHGDNVALKLAAEPGSVAFLLPAISKDDFFRGIATDGVLPRKTFSMGHAQEKRYYLECRKIVL
ncbi:MAG: DUF1015 domain-containing protein [Oscillospiraceae bacterium]|nr:DUF1015 domain-containing protein [Oscillospiraceae bacterium]